MCLEVVKSTSCYVQALLSHQTVTTDSNYILLKQLDAGVFNYCGIYDLMLEIGQKCHIKPKMHLIVLFLIWSWA